LTRTTPLPLADIDLDRPLSLIVVWQRGKAYDAGYVKIDTEIAEHLRKACATTIENFAEHEPREYYPDMQLEDEEYLYLNDEQMIADSPVAEHILPTRQLQSVNSRTLPRRRIVLYAALLRDRDDMLAFVRRSNPRPGIRSGAIFGSLGNTLRKITRPVFTLDDHFELILDEAGLVSLSQNTFETLFREVPALQQRIPEWVQAIGRSGHPFAAGAAARLAERCKTDGRLRKRVRSIAERGHLDSVTLQRIREHIRQQEKDESDFLTDDGELILDDQDPFRLVYLLNEDFFKGGLTGEGFRSDRKAPG